MTEAEQAILKELAAIRHNVEVLKLRTHDSSRVLVAIGVFLFFLLVAVAAIAFGWVEVAIKVKGASGL